METNINNADQVTDASGVNEATPLNQMDVSGGFPSPAQNVDTFNQNADVAAEGENSENVTNDTPVDLKAVNERLMQQNARNNKALSALGMDPMSDMAEQLESGLITPEMVRNHVFGNQQPQQQPTQQFQANVGQDPVAQAMQELTDARTAYDNEVASGEGVSIETNNRLLTAMDAKSEAMINNVTQKYAATEQAQQANANVDAVLNVARSDPHFAEMDAGMQQATELAFMSVTGTLANQGAVDLGLDPTTLTPQQYAHFAGKAEAQLETLKQHYINVGAAQVRNGQAPNANVNVNRQIPNPAGSGGGSVPPPRSPYQNANAQNHTEMAKQYMNGSGQV